jgi:hypothetical protein
MLGTECSTNWCESRLLFKNPPLHTEEASANSVRSALRAERRVVWNGSSSGRTDECDPAPNFAKDSDPTALAPEADGARARVLGRITAMVWGDVHRDWKEHGAEPILEAARRLVGRAERIAPREVPPK